MKKIIKTVAILLILAGGFYSCRKDKDADVIIPLQGTKWKLSGIYHTRPDTLLKVLEPKDCEMCYTLSFETDHLATAQCIIVQITLDLLNLNSGRLYTGGARSEMYNGKSYTVSSFEEGIKRVNSYSTPSDSLLKLYYCDSNYYLLFKRILSDAYLEN